MKSVETMLASVAGAFGWDQYSYEENYEKGIRLIREQQNKTVATLLCELIRRLLPAGSNDQWLRPESLDQFLSATDTKEKAETVLRTIPEPDPHSLDVILSFVNGALPNLRQCLLPFAKKLPHPAGGRPKKLADPLTRQAIREEIGGLFAKGVTLKDAERRLADRYDVSLSMIRKIWSSRGKEADQRLVGR